MAFTNNQFTLRIVIFLSMMDCKFSTFSHKLTELVQAKHQWENKGKLADKLTYLIRTLARAIKFKFVRKGFVDKYFCTEHASSEYLIVEILKQIY